MKESNKPIITRTTKIFVVLVALLCTLVGSYNFYRSWDRNRNKDGTAEGGQRTQIENSHKNERETLDRYVDTNRLFPEENRKLGEGTKE